MILKYHLDDIDIENDSKIAINKALSCFVLYNPNIAQVHLLQNDIDFLSTSTIFNTPLSSDYDYKAYDKCWFYSNTLDTLVYTRTLSGDLTHIAVLFNIDNSQLLPQTNSPFSDFSEIYAVTNNENIYQILGNNEKNNLSADEIISISHSDEYSNGVYKHNNIYSATDTSHDFLKIISVQSADYIYQQFFKIIIFLIIYLILIMLLCIFSIRRISYRVSVSLESLNKKFCTGIMQIDDLTSCLK
ncbi:MAG: hypothetical protein ACI4DY_11630 [Monoglobaceae bacterium]